MPILHHTLVFVSDGGTFVMLSPLIRHLFATTASTERYRKDFSVPAYVAAVRRT
jgi:hypothetical protein